MAFNYGEKHHMAKLNNHSVKRIKELYATGNYRQQKIADIFGVPQPIISRIVNGHIWKHVKTDRDYRKEKEEELKKLFIQSDIIAGKINKLLDELEIA